MYAHYNGQLLNPKVHDLARLATLPNSAPPFSSHVSVPDLKLIVIKTKAERFIKSLIRLCPGNTSHHNNGRKKNHSQILCQRCKGIYNSNSYLAKISAVDSDQRRCGRGIETVDHFLFCCPNDWCNLLQGIQKTSS